MKKISSIFLVLVLSALSTLLAQDELESDYIITPEGVGEHLFNLLVNRQDLQQSPVALDVDKIYPKEKFPRDEEYPALFVIGILQGQQILSKQAWDLLLHQADSLGIDQTAEYVGTVFESERRDGFKANVILKKASTYYMFAFQTIELEKNSISVKSIDDKFYIANSKNEVTEYIGKNVNSSDDLDLDTNNPFLIADEPYVYNKHKDISYRKTMLPTINALTEKLGKAIEDSLSIDKLDYLVLEEDLAFLNDLNEEEINNRKEKMSELLTYSKINWDTIRSSELVMNSTKKSIVYTMYRNTYPMLNTYTSGFANLYETENKTTSVIIVALLVKGQWKIITILPPEVSDKIESEEFELVVD